MIESILITNHLGDSITLELRFPEKSGFLIKRVDGLGPTKATINTIRLATRDGSIYNSGHVDQRNIVFSLQLVNNLIFSDSIEDIRQRSYKYFPVKRSIELEIQTNKRNCKIQGYIESNEIDIFSKEVSSQISIICPNPFFTDLESTLVNFSSVISLFEFPFSNESLTVPLLEVSEMLPNNLANIYYTGDVETGVEFKIHALGNAENITIYNETTLGTFKINTDVMLLLTGTGIINGDDIFISTIKGNKYALLYRAGVYINILNFIDPDPEWFTLTKGDNVFGFIADFGIENLQFKIEYTNLYEGV